jgi:hypothetical protein
MNWPVSTLDMYEWHRWFAWFPVEIEGRRHWLETVERRWYGCHGGDCTEYRAALAKVQS